MNRRGSRTVLGGFAAEPQAPLNCFGDLSPIRFQGRRSIEADCHRFATRKADFGAL